MALAHFLQSFSKQNVSEDESQQIWDQFLIFDFASLRSIKFVDSNMLCQASEILRRFIRSYRTKQPFLANRHNCLTYSFEFLYKELFLLHKHFDQTNANAVLNLLELFSDLCDGLLQLQSEPKVIYPMDNSFAILDLFIICDCNMTIKLSCYSVINSLLRLVIMKRLSIDDNTILVETIANIFLQTVGANLAVLKQLCSIASIYLNGVNVGIFKKVDLVQNWIEVECVQSISEELDESILKELLHCLSSLCKITKTPIHNLINKLDILISLYKNKSLERDLVIIISQAVKATCGQLNISLDFANFMEAEIKQVLQQWTHSTKDLIFILLYLDYTYTRFSRLNFSNIQIQRLICTRLDENASPPKAVLKSICLLFPLTFTDAAIFKIYNIPLLEALSKEDDLESVLTYDKNQFFWIMKCTNRGLQYKVLKHWIKKYEDQLDFMLEVISECKCGYLLPEYISTDMRDSVGYLIKHLNDSELSRILCDLIPNHLRQMEDIQFLITSGAAVPTSEKFAVVYLQYFQNIISNGLYKGCLTSIIQYVVSIARQYNASKIISHMLCNPVNIQGVLNAAYEQPAASQAWDYVVTMMYMVSFLQVQHKIEVRKPVEIDVVKLLAKPVEKTNAYTNKYNTVLKLAKHILMPPSLHNGGQNNFDSVP